MYKVKVIRKHFIQLELSDTTNVDLIRRLFNKLMVWTDPPQEELDEGMTFGVVVYTTKENLTHMFDMVGLRDGVVRNPNFVKRLYVDRKFIKKKMHRKNYLDQFADLSQNKFQYNFKKTFRKKFKESGQSTLDRMNIRPTAEGFEVKTHKTVKEADA